ncbi:unnamed protein product [Lathyrus oleraceus]|uniref:uncharacterized protein LOC127127759 n=1 Tax=Pisum sativum TaxID=3888 RepID=UPI0021D0DCAA|nr:uncharacterized protein LOC127127759 [Pisum sativum]
MPKPKPHTEISCSDKHYQLVQKILSPTVNTKSQRNCSKKSLQDLASISREDQEHQRASTNQISPSDLKPELKPFAHGMEKIEGSRTYRIQRGLRDIWPKLRVRTKTYKLHITLDDMGT